MSVSFKTHPQSHNFLKGLGVGYVVLKDLENKKHDKKTDALVEGSSSLTIKKYADVSALLEDPVIKATRNMFSGFGPGAPKKQAAESLIRRTISGKGIYRINSLVDIINSLSLLTAFPCSVYDLDQISGEITLLVGSDGDGEYEGLGGRTVRCAGRLLLKDRLSFFGGPEADSMRTSVSLKTKNALALVYSPPGIKLDILNTTLKKASSLAENILNAKIAKSSIYLVD